MLGSERVGLESLRGGDVREPVPPSILTFEDPRAFQAKSWWELMRALGVFRLCSYPMLVNHCGKVSFTKVPFYSTVLA